MNENDFGYRVRQALNEGLDRLDYTTSYRLEQARQAALARHRPVPQSQVAWSPALATAGGSAASGDGRSGWIQRLGLAAPLIALALGIVGIYQYQESRRISDMADLDFAVLLDEVPLDAYANKGFGALLSGTDDGE
ncbi:MAG: DUF3619 family protein [Burkholderiaceae bacterium]